MYCVLYYDSKKPGNICMRASVHVVHCFRRKVIRNRIKVTLEIKLLQWLGFSSMNRKLKECNELQLDWYLEDFNSPALCCVPDHFELQNVQAQCSKYNVNQSRSKLRTDPSSTTSWRSSCLTSQNNKVHIVNGKPLTKKLCLYFIKIWNTII